MHSGERALWLDLQDERRTFLSAAPAEPPERRVALWALAISTLVFAAAIPFAKVQLAPFPAFIAAYQSALVVTDLITALLLFAQFRLLGSRALLVLAAGYLFTAVMAVLHAMTFPGLLAPAGMLGAGPQTTAWMYMFWHAGFPATVVAYVVLKRDMREVFGQAGRDRTLSALALTVAAVAGAAAALTLLATAGASLLPPIMQGNRYTPAMLTVVGSTWALSAVALVVLWRKRPHTVLDLWLMVVLAAWIFDIGLAAVFNGGRYDLGFYAGRIYGLLAASFVLVVLLVENALLYRRLLDGYAGERNERQRAQEVSAELAAANKELDAFSYSISHDLRAPLRAVDGYAMMLEQDHGPKLDAEGLRLVGVVRNGARNMASMIDKLLEFSRVGRQEPVRRWTAMAPIVHEVAGEHAQVAPHAKLKVGELPDAFVDAVLFRQVWANLVGNALKYSSKRPQPVVEVGAHLEPTQVVYWVRDNGTGFDMAHAGRLFGVFQRLHSPKEFPGTGVGLAIVQRIVQRHGGRVWVEARPEEGATFHFSLPVSRGGAQPGG